MQRNEIEKLLLDFHSGKKSLRQVLDLIEKLPYEDVSFAKIDHHRSIRWGFPEVIFCQNKTPGQVSIIAKKIIKQKSNLLATRANKEQFKAVKKTLSKAEFDREARTITCKINKIEMLPGKVIIVTAGTSDIPVAAEARKTGEMLGLDIVTINDAGVAGIHRIMSHRDLLAEAAVIIVIAGMEGALASVIAGLVRSPVIAVPTSIGYGTSFNGLTPLLGMLNSCVPGIAVMNIDNGFGAASLAFKILNTVGKIL